MPEEVNPTQDTSAPQENTPAFLESTDKPETPPAPPPKEEEFVPPEWTTKPIQEPYTPQYTQPSYTPAPQYQQPTQYPAWAQYQQPPQYTPPPQQYVPPPQPQITLEQFVQNPQAAFEAAQQRAKQEALREVAPALQQMSAMAARLQQLDDFGRRQHDAAVSGGFEQARAAVRDGYKQVFSKDPAFKNKAVQERVDQAVRGYLARATEQAHVYGDFSGYANAARPSTLNAILQWAKDEAGWGRGGGEPVQYQGGFVEQGRGQPQQPRADIDDDLRDAARRMGVDESVLAARIAERKKLGWE